MLFLTTTSYKTRANNQFASKIYNSVFSERSIYWFAPSNSTTLINYDALYSILDMNNYKFNFKTPDGTEAETNLLQAFVDTLNQGFGGVFDALYVPINAFNNGAPIDNIKESFTRFADSWNLLLDSDERMLPTFTLFKSIDMTQLFSEKIKTSVDTSAYPLYHTLVDTLFKDNDGLFKQMMNLFKSGELGSKINKKINIHSSSYKIISDNYIDCYQFKDEAYDDPGLLEGDKQIFRENMKDFLKIFFEEC